MKDLTKYAEKAESNNEIAKIDELELEYEKECLNDVDIILGLKINEIIRCLKKDR